MPDNGLVSIGSEFIAEVLKVGSGVKSLSIGDIVVPDQNYVGAFNSKMVSNGVVNNTASMRYQSTHHQKLIHVPDYVSIEVGAGFSLVSQTAYSMIERAKLNENSNVLVMSGSSNTSMAIISKLSSLGVNTYVVTSESKSDNLRNQFGIKNVVCRSEMLKEELGDIAQQLGGFDVVFDPFIDINARSCITALKPKGKYITCGFYKQYKQECHENIAHIELPELSILPMLNNIEIIFNCLGETRHLVQAFEDYKNGHYDIVIDNVFSTGDEKEFLNRTFNDSGRFGKVIFRY